MLAKLAVTYIKESIKNIKGEGWCNEYDRKNALSNELKLFSV
jgi:hypothetical protein